MSIKAKDFINQFILPLWNQKSLELADTFIAPTADIQTTLVSGIGPAALKDNVQKTLLAFSDFEFDVKEVIQKDQHIIYKWIGTGTHMAEILSVPATGKRIVFSGIASGTLCETTLARYHSFSDMPKVLNQAANVTAPSQEALGPMHNNTEYIILKIKAYTGKKLTKREVECLKFWLQGFSIKHTARLLGNLSCRTIQTFRENIKRKLNVETYQQLFNLIYHHGMMPFFLTS